MPERGNTLSSLRSLFAVVLIAALWSVGRPAAAEEVPLPVGKVVELAVHDDDPGTACAVDLDTGKLITVPKDVPLGGPEEEWMRKRGIDAIGETSLSVRGLGCLDMKVVGPLPEEKWDAGADEVAALLAPVKAAEMAAMSGGDKPPATWAFQTREGSEGLLQIMGIEGEEIKIRYRLTRRLEVEEQPEANGTVEIVLVDEDTGAPIEDARVTISRQSVHAIRGISGTTGEYGTVVLDAPSGTYRGIVISRKPYTYADREAPAVFTLEPGGHIRLPIPMRRRDDDGSLTHLVLRADGVRSILGEPLPPLSSLGFDDGIEAAEGRAAAVCFWDAADDVSQTVVRMVDASGATDGVFLVHVGEDAEAAREWLRENEIDLPCGSVAGDDIVLVTWGVCEIPWIVFSDESGTVAANIGFSDNFTTTLRRHMPGGRNAERR